MYSRNVDELLSRLRPDELVLDVGGWACPLNRANWIIDAEPYETRGFYGTVGLPSSQGGKVEHFTEDTWIRMDICSRERWPFKDKQFDFVVCSHTLEDVRDPIAVCDELIRVAKAGYIEVPSREWEICLGSEHPRIAGLSHHRWLIDLSDGQLRFLPKYHLLHAEDRYSLPASHLAAMEESQKVQWLWWEDTFDYQEIILYGEKTIKDELSQFAARHRSSPISQRPDVYDGARADQAGFLHRGWHKLRQLLHG